MRFFLNSLHSPLRSLVTFKLLPYYFLHSPFNSPLSYTVLVLGMHDCSQVFDTFQLTPCPSVSLTRNLQFSTFFRGNYNGKYLTF